MILLEELLEENQAQLQRRIGLELQELCIEHGLDVALSFIKKVLRAQIDETPLAFDIAPNGKITMLMNVEWSNRARGKISFDSLSELETYFDHFFPMIDDIKSFLAAVRPAEDYSKLGGELTRALRRKYGKAFERTSQGGYIHAVGESANTVGAFVMTARGNPFAFVGGYRIRTITKDHLWRPILYTGTIQGVLSAIDKNLVGELDVDGKWSD